MRTFLYALLLTIFVASIASAEVLTSPYPLGSGKWAISAGAVQNQNFMNNSNATTTSYNGTVGYGVTDSLDAYVAIGTLSSSGIPNAEVTGSGYSLAAKYILLKEGATMPVTVGVAAQYKSNSTKTKTPLGETTATGSQIAGGIGVGKIIAPFVPYAALVYRTNATEGTEQYTQIDLTVGTMIGITQQAAIFAEYTSQTITGKAGGWTDHTSGQIAASVGYRI